jgi:hypothetical protein
LPIVPDNETALLKHGLLSNYLIWQLKRPDVPMFIVYLVSAAEQNPVENIWLPGKRFLREHWYLCKSFSLIKKILMVVTYCQISYFSQLNM